MSRTPERLILKVESARLLAEEASFYAGFITHYIDMCSTHNESMLQQGLVEAMNCLQLKIQEVETALTSGGNCE